MTTAEASATESSSEKKQALDAKRGTLFYVDPDDLTIIGLDTEDGPEHPLWQPDVKAQLEESWILNVMAFGVHTPVIARKDGDKTLVVAGRTRTRWAREANKRLRAQGAKPIQIRVVLEKGDTKRLMGVMISENEVRKSGADLITKAQEIERFISICGATREEAAEAYGITLPTLDNRRALVSLSGRVHNAIRMGVLSATRAIEWKDKSQEEQDKLAEEAIKAGVQVQVETLPDGTVQETRTVVKGRKKKSRPGRGLFRKLVALEETPDEVRDLLKWILGEFDLDQATRKFPGLKKAVGIVTEKKGKKKS